MKSRLVVSNTPQLKELFYKAHRVKYTVHPGITKMYMELKRHFWWKNMRKDVVEYVANFYTCQQVKTEHKRPASTLQPLPISGVKVGTNFYEFYCRSSQNKEV